MPCIRLVTHQGHSKIRAKCAQVEISMRLSSFINKNGIFNGEEYCFEGFDGMPCRTLHPSIGTCVAINGLILLMEAYKGIQAKADSNGMKHDQVDSCR